MDERRFQRRARARDEDLGVGQGDVRHEQPDVALAERLLAIHEAVAHHVPEPLDRRFVDPALARCELAGQAPLARLELRDARAVLAQSCREQRVAGAGVSLLDQLIQTPEPSLRCNALATDPVEVGLTARIRLIRALQHLR
ncbi:MAG TPA: hypothetical protein VF636_04090 [Sphingomonas sp.]